MAKPFFEHATPQEHFNAINEADYAVQLAMIERDLLAVESAYRVNMALADYKVMTENGTFEDLQALYEEASTEKSKGSKGIFQRLLDFIQDIFGAIKKLIFNEQGKDFEKFINSNEAKNTKVKEGVDMGAVDKSMNIVQRAFKRVKDFVSGNSSSDEASNGLVEDNNELGKTVGKIFAGVGGTVTLASLGALLWKHANGIYTFGDSIKDCVNEAKEKGGSEFVGLLRGFLRGMKKFVVDGLVKIADIIQSSMKTTSVFLNTISKTDTFKGLPDALSAALGQLKDERADKRSSDLGDTLADLEERLKNATTEAERKKIQKRIDRVKKRKDDIDYGRARRTKNFNFKDKEDAEKQIEGLKKEIEKLKDEIEELHKQDPVDEKKVDEKEDELDQKERELNDAEAQADELDKKGGKPDDPDDNDPPDDNPPGGNPPSSGGGGAAASSSDSSSSSKGKGSGPSLKDQTMKTDYSIWLDAQKQIPATGLNEFNKVLNKYQPSALEKMDGKGLETAENELTKAQNNLSEWENKTKSDTTSNARFAFNGVKAPDGKLKTIAKAIANDETNKTLRSGIQSAKDRAKNLLSFINGKDDGKDFGLKGKTNYADSLRPQTAESRNATDKLSDMWKTKTLTVDDFKSHPTSISELEKLQTTIKAAESNPSANGVKENVKLGTTLSNLAQHLGAARDYQTRYEILLKKAQSPSATDADREALEEHIAKCKEYGIYVGSAAPSRVPALKKGDIIKIVDQTKLSNMLTQYQTYQKNQDSAGYTDAEKKIIADAITLITNQQKSAANAGQPKGKRASDPNLDKLLTAIETPLRKLVGVKFDITTDSNDKDKKKVAYTPTWDSLYKNKTIEYSDSAMTNPVAHNSGAPAQYDSKYKTQVDALRAAVEAFHRDPTWGTKPLTVHGSGDRATAFVKESAFGIDFSSGLVLTESCDMVDLSRFDTDADDILGEMDNL